MKAVENNFLENDLVQKPENAIKRGRVLSVVKKKKEENWLDVTGSHGMQTMCICFNLQV